MGRHFCFNSGVIEKILGNNFLMLCLSTEPRHRTTASQIRPNVAHRMLLKSNYFVEYKNLRIYHLSTMWTNY